MKLFTFLFVLLASANVYAADCIKGGELAKKIIDKSISFYPGNKGIFYKEPTSSACFISKDNQYVDDAKSVSDYKEEVKVDVIEDIKAYNGLWIDNNSSQSNLLIKFSNGNISLEGGSEYTNSSGSTDTGDFSGSSEFSLKDGIIKVNSKSQEGCYIQLRLVGELLVVLDSGEILGNCGGYGASFSGIYKKKNKT
ncbi:hypothetical protein [Rhizobium paknamense]|uniref:Uncharacterized protein n=1 Tax=Rhizobium paknamense TaxID=1206817 RepID=A0ABU0IJ01_9HYPH|nr:hypothetical protein [Rhizobium paknamense]MDQ0458230.1 hypothetical protein [Rhizobium paknamense]